MIFETRPRVSVMRVTFAVGTEGEEASCTMDLESNDVESAPISASTAFPPPPRMPTFVPRIVSLRSARSSLELVASNPNPTQVSATIPALRLVRGRPSTPPSPPSMPPPTGSTPLRRAA